MDSAEGLQKVMMTNTELAEAIAYAFQCCDREYVGGYTISETARETMLSHLKELLAIQQTRAGMFEPPNASVSGAEPQAKR